MPMYSENQLLAYLDTVTDESKLLHTLLQALQYRYQNVYQHCVNVSCSAQRLARAIELPQEDQLHIALGGLLHDIGKLNVPSHILYKPEKLIVDERLVIERHPKIGINFLQGVRQLPIIKNVVLYHHERFDGQGYCQGLKGSAIPLEARIIGICDSFDAMISYRCYKRALTLDEARLELLNESDKQFDGQLVDVFLSIFDEICQNNDERISCSVPGPFKLALDEVDFDNPSGTDWRAIVDHLPNMGVMCVDKTDTIRYCNRFFADIRQIRQDDLTGTNVLDCHPKHRRHLLEERLSALKAGEINCWQRLMTIAGRSIENTYARINDEKGHYNGLMMFTVDVEDREKLLKLFQTNIEHLNVLVQANQLLSEVGNLNDTRKRFSRLINQLISVDNDVIAINHYQGVHFFTIGKMADFTQAIQAYLNKNKRNISLLARNTPKILEIEEKLLILFSLKLRNNSGYIAVQVDRKVPFYPEICGIFKVICNYAANAVQNHLLFTRIKEQAIRDNLTQLYNRQYFQRKIRMLNNRRYAFIVIDVNCLKDINDQMGHLAGDMVIKTTARVLKKSIRRHDYAFRYGGDEFVILLLDCGEDDVRKVVKRIQDNALEENPVPGFGLSLSIGYEMSSRNLSTKQVLRAADEKMYADKQAIKQGTNNC